MTNFKNSVEKNYIYNLIYQMLVVVIPFITTPYVSRVLNADGVGAFSYTTAVTGYFVLFGNLGISTYGQLKIAANRNERTELSKIFYELLILKGLLTATILICFIIFVTFISEDQYKSLYYVLVVQIAAAAIDIAWFLQGLEEFKKIVLRNTIIKCVSVISIFAFVKTPSDLLLYALIMNGATLLGNVSVCFFIPPYLQVIPFNKLEVFRHVRPCITYFIPTIATTIYLTLDKTMIGWFTTSSFENGYYEQAHKIEQMAVTVVTSLSVVTMPRMAYLFSNKQIDQMKSRLRQTIKFILLLSIPMCVGMMAVAPHFIPLFLGDGFEKSILLLEIFSILIVVVGLNNAVGKQVLMPTGRQKKYNITVIIGAIVNLIINLMLIPKLYSVGAAIASVIAETMILLLFIYYSRDYVSLGWIIKSSLKNIISALGMYAVIRVSYCWLSTTWMHLLMQILFGVVAYFVILLALKDEYVFFWISKLIRKVNKRDVNTGK